MPVEKCRPPRRRATPPVLVALERLADPGGDRLQRLRARRQAVLIGSSFEALQEVSHALALGAEVLDVLGLGEDSSGTRSVMFEAEAPSRRRTDRVVVNEPHGATRGRRASGHRCRYRAVDRGPPSTSTVSAPLLEPVGADLVCEAMPRPRAPEVDDTPRAFAMRSRRRAAGDRVQRSDPKTSRQALEARAQHVSWRLVAHPKAGAHRRGPTRKRGREPPRGGCAPGPRAGRASRCGAGSGSGRRRDDGARAPRRTGRSGAGPSQACPSRSRRTRRRGAAPARPGRRLPRCGRPVQHPPAGSGREDVARRLRSVGRVTGCNAQSSTSVGGEMPVVVPSGSPR